MKFIMPMVVGAVIGYITNWLAIKMLFRPYYEKRLLGIKIPFTPGLIPKERGRIARSVGEAVGEYLLSPEIIIKSVSKDENNEKFKKWVEHNINKLKESNKSIKDLFVNIDEEKFNSFLIIIEEGITNYISSEIENWGFKHDEEEVSLDEIDELELDKKSLEEIIPEDIIIGVKNYIENHDEDIVDGIRSSFNSPTVQLNIKRSIGEIVSKNVSKLITAFISVETITEKVFKAIEDYIYSPRINKDAIFIVDTLIDKTRDEKVDLYDKLQKKIVEDVPYVSLYFINRGILVDTKIQGDLNPTFFNIYNGIENCYIAQ